MLKYLLVLVAILIAIPSMASSELYADPPISTELVRDGSIDLRIILIGMETSIDIGIAGAGFRIDPDNWAEIDFEPTFLDAGLVLCRVPYFNDIFKMNCD
jgi:hypothetical protein